jgi:hypothetical protein
VLLDGVIIKTAAFPVAMVFQVILFLYVQDMEFATYQTIARVNKVGRIEIVVIRYALG